MVGRRDHARVVAHDGEPYDAFVAKIADHTADATPEQLAAAVQPWSQIEEFGGRVSAADLRR